MMRVRLHHDLIMGVLHVLYSRGKGIRFHIAAQSAMLRAILPFAV